MVEWKKLGDLTSYYRGVTYNKKQEVSLNSGGTKILRANNITLETNSLNYDDIKEVDVSVKIKDYQWLYPNDILICAGSGSKEHVGKVAFIKEQIGYAYGGFMGKIVTQSTLSPRYLFHIISGTLFKDYLKVALNSTTINNLNSEIVNNFIIPIPSLEEQNRIVGILDTFTDSIENLKQQIAQRRKQYEHYRDQLLDLEGKEGVEMIPLKDVADIGTGSSNTNEGLEKGKYPFYTRGKEVLRKNEYEFDETSIITAGDGVGVGKVFHFVSGKYALHQRAYRIHIKSEYINPRFIYYYMVSTFETYIKMKSFFAAVTSVRKPMIFNYPIPKCSLIMQQRIVSILDTFEASISNLEAQLAQRQKQYEYYRNQLLTFE